MPTNHDYDMFIASKIKAHESSGFRAESALTNPSAKYQPFDWQDYIIRWALEKGRAALFEDCGLGKTGQQVIWADNVAKHFNAPVLILCPHSVAPQTVSEGKMFGVEVTHIRSPKDMKGNGVFVTNYERGEAFESIIPTLAGVVLDESSILKSFTGKTRIWLTEAFAQTPFRLACTATPAPNDFMELGQHSEFLGVMPSNEMLSRWFINDTMNFGTYRLKGHARADFWRWMGSWAACVSNPRDIGFNGDGYDLPELNLHQHLVEVDQTKGATDELFRSSVVTATTLHSEARISMKERCEMAAKLARNEDSHAIIWCELNDESKALKELLSEAVEVRGDHSEEFKELATHWFAGGEITESQRKQIGAPENRESRIIIGKPSLFGFGMNFQHCSRQYFVGQSFSMEREYQAIRRSHRFGQKNPVHIHFIVPSTMTDVRATVRKKFEQHAEMQAEMCKAAATMEGRRSLEMNTEIKPATGHDWTLYNGDCVRIAKALPSDSIDFSVYSPPFANLYIYSSDVQDMGNCEGHSDFMEQYKFAIREKLRITKPGGLSAVHCKQTVKYSGRDGVAGLVDFRGMIIKAHEAEGWVYHSEFVIWKDPVIEMQRTKAQGLLFKQLCADSRYSRAGMPEYLIIFRKWSGEGMESNPVQHDDKVNWDYIGSDGPKDAASETDHRGRNIQIWQRYASPVWMDIRQTNVLNCAQARDGQDEKHICPLQLDVIERAIWLYSNPGDLVYSPFSGIGSEGYMALKMGRKFVGSELKPSYFKDACQWLKQATSEQDLFNLK